MTALDFILDHDYVLVFMDTLSLRMNKEPFKYASKIFPLPHLRGVLCGTGSLNTIIDWHVYVQLQVIGNTMDIPNKIAPSQLKKIHSEYDLNGTNEATIYHFGFSPSEERIKGFAFRSTNNFSLEELNDGIGIKPHDDEIIKYISSMRLDNGLDDFINIMKLQKERDEKKNSQERLGIGGSIHMFRLDKNYQFLWECYNFDDYCETYSKMLHGEGITRVP
jgi:hypothetical protein